ncbi:MAG: nucleoside monophosphate kinase [bacterium]|nr:nucleoside monophosphate kinase [bacterium]
MSTKLSKGRRGLRPHLPPRYGLGNRRVVIILGPPGSGKGTQAELIAERTDLYHLESSEVLEESFNQKKGPKFIKIEGKKYYFSEEKNIWQGGILCSPSFVAHLIKNKVKKLFLMGENLIFSGNPRSLAEAKIFIPLLEKLYGAGNIKIFLLKQKPETSVIRNSRRKICQLLRHPILYSKGTINLKYCPLDGSKLIKRKGLDDPKIIKIRLKEYRERTLPMVDFIKREGLKITEINAENSVAKVFGNIMKAMVK